jgi:hypothetical protein
MKPDTLWLIIIAAALSFARQAEAAPHPGVFKPQPVGTYVRSGAVVGGSAGFAFSILRVERQAAPDGAERMVIVYGDAQGQPVRTQAAYFHVELDEKNSRISIDLAQIQKTAVDPKELARLFSDSPLVASTEMTMDPVDLSTSIVLNLKAPAEVKAGVNKLRGAKSLVLDLKAAKPVRGARGG